MRRRHYRRTSSLPAQTLSVDITSDGFQAPRLAHRLNEIHSQMNSGDAPMSPSARQAFKAFGTKKAVEKSYYFFLAILFSVWIMSQSLNLALSGRTLTRFTVGVASMAIILQQLKKVLIEAWYSPLTRLKKILAVFWLHNVVIDYACEEPLSFYALGIPVFIVSIIEPQDTELPFFLTCMNIVHSWSFMILSVRYILIMPFYYAVVMVITYGVHLRTQEQGMELRHLRYELKKAKAKAVRISNTSKDFLATMSHEIRTPLNGILGILQLMLGEADRNPESMSDEHLEHLKLVYSSSESLLAFLNDMLDLSKLRANKMVLDLQDFNLREEVVKCFTMFAVNAHQKGLDVYLDIDPILHNIAYGDAQRLKQIISNLVSNAIKFTSYGSVTLQIESGGDGIVIFRVIDTGIGISGDKLHAVFQPYEQEDATTSTKFGGTGLGLALCKQLVQKFDRGAIAVTSTQGKGSCFRFQLRLFFDENIKTEEHDDPRKQGIVAILSDKYEVQEMLASMLEDRHVFENGPYEGVMAPVDLDVAKLLDFLRETDPIFAIVDSTIFERLGEKILETIRYRLTTKNALFGFVRICKTTEIAAIAVISGVGRIMQPVCAQDLKNAFGKLSLNQRLSLVRHSSIVSRRVSSAASLFSAGSIVLDNISEVKEDAEEEAKANLDLLVLDDNRINRLVASKMLTSLGHNVHCEDTGEKALDYLESVEYGVHCIFTDIQMDPMDGYEFTRRVREAEQRLEFSSPTFIVAITGDIQPEQIEKCLANGIDFHISKPVRMARLYECLDMVQLRLLETEAFRFSSDTASHYSSSDDEGEMKLSD